MKKAIIVLILMGLAACNTVDGIGKDIRKAGSTVSNM
ncbi:entericidin A/B family lipoprotein [Sulfitobacter sp. 1151]|uniref:Entericidin A/B family lipoprotein n=1 Tax=Parasulfitobacter algicola TaxID=2614809 RepID=A0ABX2IRJ5_9RHOB|nr:entericidin A/B family lipoprotein [Sulfitobacter algicola]